MTPDEIIKAMDEFAALQAKATPGPWTTSHGDLSWDSDRQIDGAWINEWAVEDDYNERYIILNQDIDLIAASRSVPAAEAAAIIREMRKMLRNAQWQQITSYTPTCATCGGKPQHGHAPGCRLAQMLKD